MAQLLELSKLRPDRSEYDLGCQTCPPGKQVAEPGQQWMPSDPLSWDCHSVFTKYICHHQNILKTTLGRLQQCRIHGQDLIWPQCQQMSHEATRHWSSVFRNLATLTPLDLLLDVRGHPWPITALTHKFCGALHTLMPMFLVQLCQDVLFKDRWQDKLEDFLPPIWTMDPTVQHTLLLHKTTTSLQ